MTNITRRDMLKSSALSLAALHVPGFQLEVLGQGRDAVEITINSVYIRGQWFYEPAGLFIERGTTIRWRPTKWGTSVTAFHPSNANHELRIPENARPFDSGLIGEDSIRYNRFEWTFDIEGTYDYFSRFHEPLGLVGRIVVGRPGGPAESNRPGYGARDGRAPVYPAQAKLLEFLSAQDIAAKKKIPYPTDLLVLSYPHSDRD
jgi:plastocyanin